MDLFKLGLQIITLGQKEAQQALQSVDAAGKQAAQGLGRTEAAMSNVGRASTTAAGGLENVQRQMLQTASQALGLGQGVGAVGASLGALGPIAVGVGIAALGLYEAFKQLNMTSTIAAEKADALTAALGRQKQAADAATVAGARLALQQAQSVLARTATGPGIIAGLAVAGAQALGGFGLAGAASVEAQARAASHLKEVTDGVRQAEIALAEAVKRTGDSAAKSDNEQIRALASLIKGGNDVGNQRQQALLMVQGLTQAFNALPVSDTIGRAGLAGQIKELNDALFPKLHEHLAKVAKGLMAVKQASALATAPHVGITPSKADGGAQFPGLDMSAKMPNVKEDPATKIAVEAIHQRTKEIGEAIAESQRQISEIIQGGFAQTLGDAIYNAFAAAFNGEGVGGILKAFGKTILAGVGQMFTQLGMVYLEYGVLMQSLGALLPNPFTAGPAGIAIGAALIAMGGALGAVAKGGAGRGTAQAGAFRDNNSANNVVRLKFVDRQGNPMDGVTPKAPIYNTFIGVNDPAAQRALREMYDKGGRR